MNNYEAIFIIKSNRGKENVNKTIKDINQLIKDSKCEIYLKKELGLRKLAYEIKECKDGYYYLINFKDESTKKDATNHITKGINTMEEVIKFIIIKKDEE